MSSNSTNPAPKPTHRLYIVTGEGDAAHWKEIGAAWPNRDGKGFGITLSVLPLNGRIAMREAIDRLAKSEARN